MGFGESISEFYTGVEDKFYSFMDFLSDKGIPVYSLIDLVEDRGIPAFPVFVVFLLVLALFGYGFFFLQGQGTSVQLSIMDDAGSPLKSVSVSFIDDKTGEKINVGSDLANDGSIITIPRTLGATLRVSASKNGYENFNGTLYLKRSNDNFSILLARKINRIEGKIKLIDSETGDPVENAVVVAKFSDKASEECIYESNGFYVCPQVVEGKDTSITITHPNYEQKNASTKFVSESEAQFELAPKASAVTGKTNFIVRVFDKESGERISGFTVRVFDSKTNELLTEKKLSSNENEFVEKIQKGVSLRAVVEKENYISYDSSTAGENETLRSEELIKEVYLRKGANSITVVVLDPAGRPLPQMQVMLSNKNGEILKQGNTNLAGEVVFDNLDPASDYYVSTWQDRFMPAIKKIGSPKEKNRESLVLERSTASNSGSLVVFTTDEKSKPLAGVSLKFFVEDANSNLVPMGVPPQKTDITGKFELLAPLNANVVVKASKDKLVGEAKTRILETFKNEALIQMKEPFSQVTVRVLDSKGEEVKGGIITIASGKDVLYENKYEEGGIVVNPKGAKYLSVTYTNDNGEVIDEEVFVQGVDKVDVKKGGSKSLGTTPNIEYLGVYTIDGVQAAGISKGMDYFLKFRVVFPEGKNKNGFHARIGDDAVNFVDSEDVGIIGFSANGASSYYGRSYSPKPAPGFEALDFENSGSENTYNKWIELYFQSGGEKIIKIRVKAKETGDSKETTISYRAWSEIGGKIYRNPADEELGLDAYSQSKTSLYAATTKSKIKILEINAKCKNQFCASYKFIRSDGSEFKTDVFKGTLEGLYALEVTLSPEKRTNVTLKASTPKQKPKIFFQGFGINEEGEFPNLNLNDTSIQVENVPVSPDEQIKVKIYFKAIEVGSSYISLQLVSGEETINEQFYFDIFKEKPIVIRTNPENVVFGEDFFILLEDDAQQPVENARIILSNPNGSPILTLVGNGSTNSGLNGRYWVKNSFENGVIKYSISADGFKTMDGTIEISKQGILEFTQPEIYLQIQKGKQTGDAQAELTNKSRQEIKNITFEIKPIGTMPNGFAIKPMQISGIGKNSSQKTVFEAEYTGEKETAHAEAIIIARGTMESGHVVNAKTKIIIDYNPKIPQDCVEFSKQKIVIYLASGMEDRPYYNQIYSSGATASNVENAYSPNTYNPNIAASYYKYNNFTTSTRDSFTAKLANKPNCQIELQLKPEIISEGKRAEGITIESEEIRLSPQLTDTKGRRTDNDEVIVSATNKIIRNYAGKEKFSFDIIYKTEGFEKSIPVEVYIWNPRFALMVTRNIELFLGPDQQGRYSAQVPLFVRNVGEADIENIDFRVSSTSSRGNVNLSILPPYTIQFLRKGDVIEPPKLLVAQVLRNEKTTLVEQKEIDITGVIDGQTFNFGPVIVTAHVSADQCLIAVPGNVAFFSAKYDSGTLMKPITLKNTCAEEVSVIDITKPLIGNNYLYMAPASIIIPPGTEVQVNLQLDRKSPFDGSPQPIYFLGFLPRSGSPMQSTPVIVDIKLGNIAKKGEAATEIQEINVCESENSKEKKPVRFPIIATGNNPQCDTAYCDAKQLAEYIADRIEQKIMDAEKQINTKSAEISKTNCAQIELAGGYCKFSGLGVKTEQFTVYMSHDNMTPAMLSKALETRKGSARNFLAKPFEGKEIGPYIGGYSRQVWMNGSFRGCGRYTITIDGAVAVQGSRILPELMNIIVDSQNEEGNNSRQTTEQCLPKVQNVMNFLPKDEGLTKTASYETWLGVVNSRDSSLEELSKEIAKSLFGSDQRATQSEASTNNLKLDLSNESDYIVKIRMPPASPNNPVTVEAFIKESIGGDEKLQKEIVKEAAQAIKNLRENVINGCIGVDESYLKIKATKDIGLIEVKAGKEIKVQYGTPSCTDFNVLSDIKENAILTAKKATQFDGVDEPFFIQANSSNETITQLKIDKLDQKTNKFIGEAKICVKGNSQIHQAQGKAILGSAKRIENEAKNPKWEQINLQICGIHPLDFMEKIREKQPSKTPYYATFIWKGKDNDKILISDIAKLNKIESNLKTANQIEKNEIKILNDDPPEVKAAKTKANLVYLGICSITSAITSFLRPTIGRIGALFNIVFDCGIPYAYNQWGDKDIFKDFTGFVEKITKPIVDALKLVYNGASKLLNLLFGAIGVGETTNPNQQLQQIQKAEEQATSNIIEAFVPAQTLKSIIQSSSKINTRAGIVDRTVLAKSIAEEISREVAKNTFDKGIGNRQILIAFEKSLQKDIEIELLGEFDEIARENARIDASTFGRHVEIPEEEKIKAVQNVIRKVGSDKKVLGFYYENRKYFSYEFLEGENDEEALERKFFEEALEESKLMEKIKLNTDEFPELAGFEQKNTSQKNEILNKLIDRIEAKLKRELKIQKLPKELEELLKNELQNIPNDKIVVYDIKNKFTIINNQIERYVLYNPEILKDTVGVSAKEKYEKWIKEQYTKTLNAEKIVKKAKPGWKAFFTGARTLLKEGAFGALANFVGMKFYELSLEESLKNTPLSRGEELNRSGIDVSLLTIEGEDMGTQEIINYRTYKIIITQTPEEKKIIISGPAIIPEGTSIEQVLNECNNQNINNEIATVLPGLLPDAHNPPSIMIRKGIEIKHASMVLNYLKKQESGERIGVIISEAVKDEKTNFKSNTDLDLEAMVVSLGVVKSGLGIDKSNKYMFGCNLKKQNKEEENIYNNAICAKKKLISYMNECNKDPGCYLDKYNQDNDNQTSNYITINNNEEFNDIYKKWASYAWN
jgi:hypothetical protein